MAISLDQLRQRLETVLGPGAVSTDAETISSRSHDFWLLGYQQRLHGVESPKPAAVVQVRSHEEVVRLLAFAQENAISIVPFGAGSGVCGGVVASSDVIVLDMSKMNRVVKLNEMNLTVTVEAGMLGRDFEAWLNAHDYSMGHFPQSINLSSVGGWVATRASGQYSTKYGSIEEMLVSVKAVLADGTTVETGNAPRSSTGPDLKSLFMGSEGTLAVITEVTYRIHPMPEKESGCAFVFEEFHLGLEAIRHIMRTGWKPALVRLYDEHETKRHFEGIHKGGSVLLLLSEGPAALVDVELAECSRICETAGAQNIGTGAVDQWLEQRFKVQDIEDLAVSKGVVFDTIEISANWDNIHELYTSVVDSLNKIPGMVAASAHSSHSYQQGTCLYFSFAVKKPHWLPRLLGGKATFGRYRGFTAKRDAAAVERLYNICWQAVIEATIANHGTISHHHGIGKVRLPWIGTELGAGLGLLKAVKAAVDPKGILNPGTLIPEDAPQAGSR